METYKISDRTVQWKWGLRCWSTFCFYSIRKGFLPRSGICFKECLTLLPEPGGPTLIFNEEIWLQVFDAFHMTIVRTLYWPFQFYHTNPWVMYQCPVRLEQDSTWSCPKSLKLLDHRKLYLFLWLNSSSWKNDPTPLFPLHQTSHLAWRRLRIEHVCSILELQTVCLPMLFIWSHFTH